MAVEPIAHYNRPETGKPGTDGTFPGFRATIAIMHVSDFAVLLLMSAPAAAGVRVGTFAAEVRTAYTVADGLPDNEVFSLAVTSAGEVYAGTAKGLARFAGGKWSAVAQFAGAPVELVAARGPELMLTHQGALYRLADGRAEKLAALPAGPLRALATGPPVLVATGSGLFELAGSKLAPVPGLKEKDVRHVALGPKGEIAVAAAGGLYLRTAPGDWQALYPQEGGRSWAPRDVRGVAFDSRGRLWFASPQGSGCLNGAWKLYSGHDGLPYDDFTTVAAGEDGVVWFGTRRGAIRYDGKNWEYRQGLRWLPDDVVRAATVTPEGHAWFATAKGAGVIERKPVTLGEKVKFFEDEIDRRHRRTPFGYVLSVRLNRPGDKSEWVQHDSDNDGLWTSMYGAGECFAYAATKNPLAKKRARAAFEALRFLGTVTQGGEPPAPPGFVARTILPASGPNPNLTNYTRERDEARRASQDRLWKVLSPRWPRSADGKWYWKSDTSSDELDGHYFFYAQYYDLVAETPQEKDDVRKVVTAITDHLLAHNFTLVDWDGKPTRWAVFNPEALNQDSNWWGERGLNSLSVLSYLKVAGHMTGDAKYHQAAERLIKAHHYATNLMVPKIHAGPASGNQSDDEMALMSYYNLLKYETDPALRARYAFSFHNYWQMEKPELNPLFNFLYAASCTGSTFTDAFRARDLSPRGEWLEESIDTLRRYPLDRVDWRITNSHRKDIVPLVASMDDEAPGRGFRRNGKVLPIDERFVEYWNHDPWRLDQGGQGLGLADGASFLLPYYLGLYHGFILD